MIGGDEYVHLLRDLITDNPRIDTATDIPRAAAGFEAGESGADRVFDVRTIDGQPIARTRFNTLYIAYFGAVDSFAPPGGGHERWRGLLKMNWGACVVAFEDS